MVKGYYFAYFFFVVGLIMKLLAIVRIAPSNTGKTEAMDSIRYSHVFHRRKSEVKG